MRTTSAALAVLGAAVSLLLGPEPSAADEFHYENLRFGQRAMGMGGAVTAYPIEPEASFYNPAGLAFLDNATFSGALTFFGEDVRKLTGSFRGEERDPNTGEALRVLFEEDETSDTFLALPSSAVISKSFGRDKQHVLAYSTFLVNENEELFSNTITLGADTNLSMRMGGAELGQIFASSLSRADSILYTGGSYGWRVRPDLGLGFSVFYARREQEFHITRSLVERIPSDDAEEPRPTTRFLIANGDSTISDGALLARLGALYHIDASWSVGASCSTRSIRLHGSGDVAYTLIASGTEGDGENEEVPTALFSANESGLRAQTVYPWSCRLGGAWLSPSLVVTSDISVHLPQTYTRLSLPNALFQSDNFKLRAVETQFDNVIERQWVVNAALGVEARPSPKWPIRAGAFTNFSAAPDIDSQAPSEISPNHIDLFGITLSAGYLGDDRSINLGIEYQRGSGDDVVIRDLADLAIDPQRDQEATFMRVEREQHRFLFFLAGAFEFASQSTDDLLDDDEQ